MNEEKSPLEDAWDKASTRDGWPAHIKPMTFQAGTGWGFDRKGNMYFNLKKLEFSRKIQLSLFQMLFAGLTALGVFLGGLGTLLNQCN